MKVPLCHAGEGGFVGKYEERVAWLGKSSCKQVELMSCCEERLPTWQPDNSPPDEVLHVVQVDVDGVLPVLVQGLVTPPGAPGGGSEGEARALIILVLQDTERRQCWVR